MASGPRRSHWPASPRTSFCWRCRIASFTGCSNESSSPDRPLLLREHRDERAVARIDSAEDRRKREIAGAGDSHVPEAVSLEHLDEAAVVEDRLVSPGAGERSAAALNGERISETGFQSRDVRQRKDLPAHRGGEHVVPTAAVLRADHGVAALLQNAKHFGDEHVDAWNVL